MALAGQKIKALDIGFESTYTPVVTQGVTVTMNWTEVSYSRLGSRVTGNLYGTATSSGTASQFILVTVPLAILTTAAISIAYGFMQDVSAVQNYPFIAYRSSSTQMAFMGMYQTPGYLGPGQFTAGLATGDVISITFNYRTSA